MPLNKNKDNNYVGYEDIIESQEHSKNYKSIVKQIKSRKSHIKKDKKQKELENTTLFKYARLYEINNGSGYSVLEENLTNFNISTQAKHLTDLVTYVATKEFDDVELADFNYFLRQCSKCIKEIQQYDANSKSKKKKLNLKAAEYKNKFPEDVYLVASTANNLVSNVANNAENILKLYKGKNRIIFTPENYVVYNLSTVGDSKLKDEVNLANSVLIPRVQQAYRAMFKEQIKFERIPTLNNKINNFNLNDALLIDSNFNVNELPDVYLTLQSQNANARTNFLTDMNRNRFALMKNTDLPLTIVRFPQTEYNSALNKDVDVDYSAQQAKAINNLKTKYPNLELTYSNIITDKIYSGYAETDGVMKVNVKTSKSYENESAQPKNIINAIFQTERAFNEVSVKDINHTLLLDRKLRVKKEEVNSNLRLGFYKKKISVSEKDLLIKDKTIKQFFKNHNIYNYESLMQRAIALGATMNTLKIADYLDPQAVKACNLFLESQFNKTISLLSSLDENWVLPYITEKISQSFEREVNSLGLTKQDVLDRLEHNGMAVNADTSCTLRQIAFAKPKYQNVLKQLNDADSLKGILSDILKNKASEEELLNNNKDYNDQKSVLEVVLEERQAEEEAEAEQEKPLELIDVKKMVMKVFEREHAKVEKKIFDKSEKISNEETKARYNSAYLLSSTVIDLYSDIINPAEMSKNEIKKDALLNKENLSTDEQVLKTALEYNEGYSIITNMFATQIYNDTLSIAEATERTDKRKIAKLLANSLSKTIGLMIARDYEKECNINIIRKDVKEESYVDILKEKSEEIISESEK